jgi:hypothetical protein
LVGLISCQNRRDFMNVPECLSYALVEQENDVHRHTVPRRPVGSLDGPSKTITVEPIRLPATQPARPAVSPEPAPERPEPSPERESVPAQ